MRGRRCSSPCTAWRAAAAAGCSCSSCHPPLSVRCAPAACITCSTQAGYRCVRKGRVRPATQSVALAPWRSGATTVISGNTVRNRSARPPTARSSSDLAAYPTSLSLCCSARASVGAALGLHQPRLSAHPSITGISRQLPRSRFEHCPSGQGRRPGLCALAPCSASRVALRRVGGARWLSRRQGKVIGPRGGRYKAKVLDLGRLRCGWRCPGLGAGL